MSSRTFTGGFFSKRYAATIQRTRSVPSLLHTAPAHPPGRHHSHPAGLMSTNLPEQRSAPKQERRLLSVITDWRTCLHAQRRKQWRDKQEPKVTKKEPANSEPKKEPEQLEQWEPDLQQRCEGRCHSQAKSGAKFGSARRFLDQRAGRRDRTNPFAQLRLSKSILPPIKPEMNVFVSLPFVGSETRPA